MPYEARHHRGIHLGLAAAVLLLSLIGFAAAGVIPTESGSYPLVGWGIVAACFLAAGLFVKRALDPSPQARIDERGVWSRRLGPDPIPWSEVTGFHVLAAGIQRIARFERGNGRTVGINTTFYDRGIRELTDAVRHHRPDLVA